MIALLAAIFGFSLGKFVDIESTYLVEKLQNQEIADMIEEGEGEDGEVKDINAKNEDGILKQYEEVYGRNNDFIGWLKVPDTNINYPVMYTPDDPEHYLRLNFDKQYAISGTPFVGEGCDVDNSDSFVIYGHMMNNRTMFAQLKDYESKDFWQNHQTVNFDTIHDHRTYQIFAAFKTEIPSAGQEGFRYYDLVGELNEQEYKDLLDGIKAKQFYDTGKAPTEGQQIMILSTCSYHAKNGRCVVAAYRIS